MKTPNFDQFKKTFTNGVGKRDRRMIEQYGDISFEDAYPLYLKRISSFFGNQEKINAFEKHLISLGVNCTESNVSESRYYTYEGVKYRFSSHVYPTGSMTSDFCIDFAADPELINDINF